MLFYAKTHVGKLRQNNEDFIFIPDAEKGPDNAVIVADGLGGHKAGEIASSIAVQGALDVIRKNNGRPDAEKTVAEAMEEANSRVIRLSRGNRDLRGMGTTLTIAILSPDAITIGHAGDCSAFLRNGAGLQKITEDHTLLNDLIKKGAISPMEAMTHPQRNIITKALGIETALEPDIFTRLWREGDMLLLCSDGLTTHVSEAEIGEVLDRTAEPADIPAALVDMALSRGGYDNISVILAVNASKEANRSG